MQNRNMFVDGHLNQIAKMSHASAGIPKMLTGGGGIPPRVIITGHDVASA